MRNYLLLLTTIVASMASTAAYTQDLDKKTFEACVACHSVKPDENGVGPNLHNLIGRTAGSVEGFRYSGPMKRSGIVWDEKTLTDFLRNPQEMLPGTRMPFSGMQDEAALKALVKYLSTATK